MVDSQSLLEEMSQVLEGMAGMVRSGKFKGDLRGKCFLFAL